MKYGFLPALPMKKMNAKDRMQLSETFISSKCQRSGAQAYIYVTQSLKVAGRIVQQVFWGPTMPT